MGCLDHVTMIEMSSLRQGSYGISGSGVDADPRISSIHMIDIDFNNPAAVAVWSNNG